MPSKRTILRVIVNLAGWDIGWTAAVLGAAKGMVWLGPVVVAGIVGINLSMDPRWRRTLKAIVIVSLIGGAVDVGLLLAGVFSFPAGEPAEVAWFALWVGALWVNFAAVLGVSLRWLFGKILLAAALGAVSGPLTYWLGARLGAIGLHESLTLALGVLAIEWAVLLPVCAQLFGRIQRRRTNECDQS